MIIRTNTIASFLFIACLLVATGCESGPSYLEVSKQVEVEESKLAKMDQEITDHDKLILEAKFGGYYEEWLARSGRTDEQIKEADREQMRQFGEQSAKVARLRALRDSLAE